MPYVFRPHRRFPIFSPARYEIQHGEGYGTITNLSSSGWRLHGNLPAKPGDVCSMKVRLAVGNGSLSLRVRCGGCAGMSMGLKPWS